MEKEVADVLLIENEYLSRISSKCNNIINKHNIDTIYEIHSSFDVFNFASFTSLFSWCSSENIFEHLFLFPI